MTTTQAQQTILSAAIDLTDGERLVRVDLAALRFACWRLTRQQFDAALVELSGRGVVALFPADEHWLLTEEQRAAALDLCGCPQHYLYVDRA